jgi:hypothetical protein
MSVPITRPQKEKVSEFEKPGQPQLTARVQVGLEEWGLFERNKPKCNRRKG